MDCSQWTEIRIGFIPRSIIILEPCDTPQNQFMALFEVELTISLVSEICNLDPGEAENSHKI